MRGAELTQTYPDSGHSKAVYRRGSMQCATDKWRSIATWMNNSLWSLVSNKGLISMAMGVKYGFDIELCNLCKIYMSSIAGFMMQLSFLCFQ